MEEKIESLNPLSEKIIEDNNHNNQNKTPNLENTLIIYKKSLYDIFNKNIDDPNIREYLENNEIGKEDILNLHDLHNRTLDFVVNFFQKNRLVYDLKYRSELDNRTKEDNKTKENNRANENNELVYKINNYDLIISVGGDGTLLSCARFDKNIPIVGINTTLFYKNGENIGSLGYFCGIDNTMNLNEKLSQLINGEIAITNLNRLEAEINGKKIDQLILNEIFACHENPAATSRYRVKVEYKDELGLETNASNEELNKKSKLFYNVEDNVQSSGIMIAAPQQCWAIQCGGEILPINRKNYQIVARERVRSKYNAIIVDSEKANKKIETEIISMTRRGKIYCDGSRNVYDFTLGSKLKVKISDYPLPLIGFDNERRLKEFAVKKEPAVLTI